MLFGLFKFFGTDEISLLKFCIFPMRPPYEIFLPYAMQFSYENFFRSSMLKSYVFCFTVFLCYEEFV
jgi:hypothetical protein